MDIITILMTLSSLIVLLFPLVFALIVRKKTFGTLKATLLGLAGYLVAEFGINNLIRMIAGSALEQLEQNHEMLSNIEDCFQQGIVEEGMRFVLMLFLMKNFLEKENSLMYAAGHGGVEMMIRGFGLAAGVVTAFMHPEDSPYEGMPIFSPFLIPFAFVFIFCLHIGLSYLVYRAVKDRKYYLVLLAVLLHALANLSTMLEVPLLPLLGPVAVIVGLMIYTVRSYRREEEAY